MTQPPPIPTPNTPAAPCCGRTARCRPRGLAGLLYWYSVLPLHGIVFRGMLAGIRRAAESADS